MLKMNMVLMMIFTISFLCSSLGLAEAGQEEKEEPIQLHNLYTTSLESPHSISSSGLAIWVDNKHLNEISSSVLKAEAWLRTHVLSHYPSTHITTILVGNTTSHCHNLKPSLLLPSLSNIHHSLTRWGLHKHIKLSPTFSFSSTCLNVIVDLVDYSKPILEFLKAENSTLTVISTSIKSAPLQTLLTKSLDLFNLTTINLILTSKPIKLSSLPDPFPSIPNPQPKSSIGLSVPSNIAPTVSPSCISPSSLPPMHSVNNHNHHPAGAPISAPPGVIRTRMWCVAKPSVPAVTLQAAMDYACGEGGADCGEIAPSGRCYEPDNVVAHASYAFNSYWQKSKRVGGTCSFGGTAMMINSDPSFLNCRFDFE